MRGSSTSPPEPEPGAESGHEPALSDVRALRRWTAVAGVWAVAATAVGLIALLDTSGDEAERSAGQIAERAEALGRDQRRLERRIESLGERIDGLPQAEDLDTLEGRIGSAEDDAGEASSRASGAADRIDALEQRIEDLEGAAPAPGDGDSGDQDGEPDPE